MAKISATTFENHFPLTQEVLDLLVGATIQHKKLGLGVIKEVIFSPIPKITVNFTREEVHENYVYQVANIKDLFIDIELTQEKTDALHRISQANETKMKQQDQGNASISFLSIPPTRFKNFAQSKPEHWMQLISMGINHKKYGDGKIINVVYQQVPGFFILFPRHSKHRTVYCSLYDFDRHFTQLFLSSDLYVKIVQSETKKSFAKIDNPPTLSQATSNTDKAIAKAKAKGKSRPKKIIPVEGSHPKSAVICPECSCPLRLKNLIKHYAKTHPSQPIPDQVKQVSESSLGQKKQAKKSKPYWLRPWTKFSGGVIYPISMNMIRVGGRR